MIELQAKKMLADMAAHAPERSKLRGECESEVVKWQWANGPVRSVIPFRAEMDGYAYGRLLRGRPKNIDSSTEAYGYDALGRLRIVRSYEHAPNGFHESFVRYTGDVGHCWHFDVHPEMDHPPIAVVVLHVDAGRVVYAVQGGRIEGGVIRDRFQSTQYVFAGQDLVSIVTHLEKLADGTCSQGNYRVTSKVGKVSKIEFKEPDGRWSPVFMARPPSLTSLLTTLQEELPGAIEEAVSSIRPSSTLYCALIPYGSECAEELVPDVVLLCPVEVLARLATRDDASANDCWTPYCVEEAGGVELELEQPKLRELASLFLVAVKTEKQAQRVRKALVRVTRVLQTSEVWRNFDLTEEFVVLAVDHELADLERNAQEALGARRLRAAREWLQEHLAELKGEARE